MIRRLAAVAVTLPFMVGVVDAHQTPAADPQATIGDLGSLTLSVRTEAAHSVRRWPRETAVPKLVAATRTGDSYVRYRALILLTDFGGTEVGAVMHTMLGDANDRLRGVAYAWFERHPDRTVVPVLLQALGHESSEFIRPALVRAVAASGSDAAVQTALLTLLAKGGDVDRAAAIAAVGDCHATYALKAISALATAPGPLQAQAIEAVGKLGDLASASVLAPLVTKVDRPLQPVVAAAIALTGVDADDEARFVAETLDSDADGHDPALLAGAAHALAMLAVAGREHAAFELFDAGDAAADAARTPVALEVGRIALRQPDLVLKVIQQRSDRAAAVALVRDAFDALSEEDFGWECFYIELQRTYWAAAEGSAERQTAGALIDALEF